jgi:hypothetical protein
LAKKVLTIIILAIALGSFLYLRPYIFKKEIPPRLIDRLPDAEFIGKANILELARETSGMMFYNKVSFRDFTSYEFILSQSKMYGINLQKPAYLFGNENGSLGALMQVTDSSKTANGIERIKNFIAIRDTNIFETRIWYSPKEKTYIHYGKNYLLVYKGTDIENILEQVVRAKNFGINKEWKKFLSQTKFNSDHLVISSNWKKLKQFGFETAMFAHDSDSLSFNLKCYVKKKAPFYLKNKPGGISFSTISNSNKSVEMHFNVDNFNKHPEDSLYATLLRIGKKFGFPIVDFFNAWEGDLCFAEGGLQKVKEKYITTELDEEFNTTEVEKTREVEVPGYSLLISTNKKAPVFVNKLFQKGYLRQDGKQFRILFSPLLNLIQTKEYFALYSGEYLPEVISSNQNKVVWTSLETKYTFQIDSLNNHELFGSMQIPVARLFKRNQIN